MIKTKLSGRITRTALEGQGGVALCLKHAHEGEWQAGKSCLACDRDYWKAKAERLEVERNEAVKLSRCECAADELCENLVKHARRADEAEAEAERLREKISALAQKWRLEAAEYPAEGELAACAVRLCAKELDELEEKR